MVDMHHTENLLALVRHLDLRDVTLVVHDWGGPIGIAGHFGRPDPVGKAEVITQWHAALPRMAEMTFLHPGVGHFSEEVKGPEMAQSILEMNWSD